MKNLIISGSSITDDQAWPTWATMVKRRYNFKSVTDLSVRGAGNEVIITNAINAARKISQDIIIVIQLTSIDKWDWYVQNPELIDVIQKEKHPGTKIEVDDTNIFWCTGSHFPLWKEYYQKNYLSIDHLAFKTLQMLQWFVLLCKNNNWEYYILFESPILSVTEQQLDTGHLSKKECSELTLIDNKLCQTISSMIDLNEIYLPGLIGYACTNDLEWFHSKFKSHPGSLVHYYYATDVIFPALDLKLSSKNFNAFREEEEAKFFQKMLNQI